jgi:hypothetical protein
MYDLIGDIHGHALELKALLRKLGYEPTDDGWVHRERKVIFLGDYIDRGPEQRESVNIVRGMVRAGNALAIMGNHEFNAIGFSTLAPDGESHLRPHTDNNRRQHKAFLDEFPAGSPEYHDVVDWFKSLPLALELPQLRAIHACYDARQLAIIHRYLGDSFLLNDESLSGAFLKDSELYEAIEVCLKGIEIDLPDNASYLDKDGIRRFTVRCKWWETGLNSIKEAALAGSQTKKQFEDCALPDGFIPIYDNKKPVFFGHYWDRKDNPHSLTDYAACLDLSVANKEIDDGKLCAYRMGDELTLQNENFVYVESRYAASRASV